jgi:Flp pilus assembly protein TadG
MHRLPTIARRRRGHRTGTYAVEVAFTFPILVLLLFGFYELARANLMRNLARGAAYEAARSVIVAGATTSEGTQTASSMLQVLGVSSPTVKFTPKSIGPTTDEISVTVSFPAQTATGFGNMFLGGVTHSATCALQREGFVTPPPPPPPPPPAGD